MAAVYSVLRFVRSYTSETHAVPVGVALWSPDQGYVGFKTISKNEPVRKLDDERDQMLVDMALERIQGFLTTRTAPYAREPGNPCSDQWWDQVRKSHVHSLTFTEPRVVDVSASAEGLDQLYEMIMRPFRIPAVLPPDAHTDTYAELRDGSYTHFYPSVVAVQLCSPRGPIHKVRVRPDPKGSHWGWWDAERQHFTMIWPTAFQVDMCFPSGAASAEARGRGLVTQLSVEKLGDAQ